MRWSILCVMFLTLAGCGVPSFLVTPVANTNQLEEDVVEPGKGFAPGRVAIIELDGTLINAQSGGLLRPTENPLSLFRQRLDQAAKDSSVKAIVLRINSPGGTVTAADTMYQELLRFKEKSHKPVVAAAQEITASGGYYVALGANQIVANPTSLVGSIGVIFYTFDVEGTMSKLGIRSATIKSGRFKDLGSPFHELTPDERAIMQGLIDEYYHRFVDLVKSHRPIKDEQTLKLVTDGRVFSGQRAMELGLVDKVGTLTDAITVAKELGKVPNAQVILYKRPYGYGGSIYASSPTRQPEANVVNINLPGARELLPTGFYYLWEP